ncbi:odorant receptor 13a-like isoform X3 [Linepithema humile]|uniref:odorant receptor 13a-like isoform X3 n=1 Tax=Linepithema humile TaxID=83485 RepID=UPI00351DB6B6
MSGLGKSTMGRASTISESVEAGLRFIGMWPRCIYANINWWTYIVSVAVVQYFQYSYILAHFDMKDLSVTIDGLSITLGYSLSFLKLINLWFNRRKLYVILDTMDKDWSDGIQSDVSTMIRHANLSRQCSNIMITTNALAVFFYTIGGPILRSIINKSNQETTTRELPIKMEFPFNVDNSPIFELVLVIQLFHDLSVACIIAMLNALLVTLSVGTDEGATVITKSLIFYVAITLEAFVFCYAGEYLSAKSKSISDAAYECFWYDLTPSECRVLMFLMLRSQKRLTITAGKMTDLSLEGFTTIMKSSASYISVLRALY